MEGDMGAYGIAAVWSFFPKRYLGNLYFKVRYHLALRYVVFGKRRSFTVLRYCLLRSPVT